MTIYSRFLRLFVGGWLLFLTSSNAWPHSGEDHSGDSLATSGGATIGAPIHVPKESQFLLGIETARVIKNTVPRSLRTLGRAKHPPTHQAEIHSPFEGLLVTRARVAVPTPGQRVKKGDVLAFVEQVSDVRESVSLATEITRTESELKQAREEASLAGMDLDRVQQLGDSVSARRLAQVRSADAVARQKVTGLERALGQLLTGQQSTGNSARIVTLKAPISGVIVAAHVTPGEYVKPEKLLFEIVNTKSIWVEADIYETDLALVEKARRALIHSEAYPNEKLMGTLAFIGQRLDPNSRTIKAVFNVKNDHNRLREGMFVDVLIETQIQETGLMFSKSAVVNERGRKVIYVKTAPETFVARPVEIIGLWGDLVMASAGVQEGDIVVVQGMYQVRSSANTPLGQSP